MADDARTGQPEHELRRYASVLEHNAHGIARLDADGRLVEVNEAYARMIGRQATELSGSHWVTTVHPDDHATVAAAEAAMKEFGRADAEAQGLRADGSTFAMEVSFVQSPGEDTGHYRFIRDISDRHRSTDDLRRTADNLGRSNADLSEFAAVTAHDLRAPLQVISGFAELLYRQYGPLLDERGREFADWIVRGAERMAGLIDDLLEGARAGPKAVVGPVDLDAVLDRALEDLRSEVNGATVERPGPLPLVLGDPVQLGLVLQNLIANAHKFVPEGETPRVSVAARRESQVWVVTVDDDGIGIDQDDRSRIFEMFERAVSPDRYEGTGIGLAICNRIVSQGGGRIWVEAGPTGRGSRFSFTVAAAEQAETAPVRPVAPVREPHGSDGVPPDAGALPSQMTFTPESAGIPGSHPYATGEMAPVSVLLDRSLSDGDRPDAARTGLHDPLTGLPNRTLILDRLGIAVSRCRRTSESVVVFYLELDGIDTITQTLGRAAGDAALVQVARRLPLLVRPHDTAGRMGAKEFVVVCEGLRGADGSKVEPVRHRLLEALRHPVDLGHVSQRVGMSVGIAIASDGGETREAVLSRAVADVHKGARLR